MKNIIYLLILIIIVSSCDEYEYEKPLTPVCKSYIDTNVIGVWRFEKLISFNNFNLQIDSHYLIIMPFNKKQYIIMFQSTKSNSNNLPLFYKAHLSNFKSKTFANVQSLIDFSDKDLYVYYAFETQNDSLYYWGYLKNKMPYQFNPKKFFSIHYKDTSLMSAIRVYKRIKYSLPIFPAISNP
jgi:hypothetical protein